MRDDRLERVDDVPAHDAGARVVLLLLYCCIAVVCQKQRLLNTQFPCAHTQLYAVGRGMRFTKFGLMRWAPADAAQREHHQGVYGAPAGTDDGSPRKRPRLAPGINPPLVSGAGSDDGDGGTSSASLELGGGQAPRQVFASFSSYDAAFESDGEAEQQHTGTATLSGDAFGWRTQQLSRYGEPKFAPGDDPHKLGGMWLLVRHAPLLWECCWHKADTRMLTHAYLSTFPGPRRDRALP